MLVTISAARLEKIASDPRIKSSRIPHYFNAGRAAFFTHLSRHPELWEVYAEARRRAGIIVCERMPAELRRTGRRLVNSDEMKILEAIVSTDRSFSAIREAAVAAGVASQRFAALLYNLQHEKHEVWSREEGQVTRFYLRDEESTTEGTEQTPEQKRRHWNREPNAPRKEAA